MDIEAVKARCKAASKGPWAWHPYKGERRSRGGKYGLIFDPENLGTGRGMIGGVYQHDGQHIAHARTDLPDAIELIEEMEGVLGDAGDKLAGCDGLAWARRCDAVLAKVRKA